MHSSGTPLSGYSAWATYLTLVQEISDDLMGRRRLGIEKVMASCITCREEIWNQIAGLRILN